MMVRIKRTDDPSVVVASSAPSQLTRTTAAKGESLVKRLLRGDEPGDRSLNMVPTNWSSAINALRPDVVNIHWIGAAAMSIGDVARISAPVVITLHDMWPFSGAEHYASDSPTARWRDGYSPGSRAPSAKGLDIDRWVYRRKAKRWKGFSAVCPSTWLAQCARESALMHGWPISVIPNPLDLSMFRPRDKAAARQEFDLPSDARVVLFGAQSPGTDPRKGADLLISALDRLGPDDPELFAVVFGEQEPAGISHPRVKLRWLGSIDSPERLAQLYSAADVMVVPSRQDNLPQTGTEAQACGVPVVAFRTAGLVDVVDDRHTGYLAEPFSTEDLANGIRWALSDDRGGAASANARTRAERLWSSHAVAHKYADLYRDAIDSGSQ